MTLKIIFMGTSKFSVPILKSIHDADYDIIQVYTQPPKKKNRGQKINQTPVHNYSDIKKINVRHPETLNTDEELDFFKKIKPDIVVVAAYGQILPKKLLNIKKVKFINVHASLLPKWRGAAPIQRSIMNQDTETGISIMKIIPKLDAGPVMMKDKIKISKDTNFENLSQDLSQLAAKMIIKSIKLIESGKANFTNQNEEEATYANKIEKKETKINWADKAKKILAKINAFYPSPGSWFDYKGARFKVNKAIEVQGKGRPGEILDNKLTIACAENAIQILEIQKEGKKNMSVLEFLKGNNFEIGSNVN